MSKSITQDMAYRQSLMNYAAKYGVSRASRKHNKSRSYIYFWRRRWDGSVEAGNSRKEVLPLPYKPLQPKLDDITASLESITSPLQRV